MPTLRWLLLLYVLFTCLPRLEWLPLLSMLGPSIHVTELLFIPLVALAVWHGRGRLIPDTGSFVWCTVAFLGVLTLATLRADQPQGYFELTARYYLFAVFIVFYWAIRYLGPAFLRDAFRYWCYGAGILVFLAYLGYPLALLTGWKELVWVYPDYPYFGTVYRAAAAAGGSIALIFIILLPILSDYRRWRQQGTTPWFLLLCLPLFVLTFSKEALLLPIALLTLEAFRGGARLVCCLLIGFLVVGYNLSTHYFFQPRQDIAGTPYAEADYSPGTIVWQSERYQVLETTYTALKRVALYRATQHPLLGLGADQFHQAFRDDWPAEIYPERLPAYAPHSTWLGVLAEAGLLGLLAFSVMVYGLCGKLRDNLRGRLDDVASLNYVLAAFFVSLAVASVNYDLLHRVFVWVPLALVLGQVGAQWGIRER